jgi:ribosomal protein S27AE
MKNLIQNIFEKNFDAANQIAEEKITEIFEQKLVEMKKIIMAKEQRQAWTEMPGGSEARREKLYRGVIEEDDLDEMDLSREKPSTDIEDRRTSVVQNQNKTSLPGTQNTSDEGKDDLKTTVIQKNMSEEDKKIDMTNKTCTKCHKGKYHETSQHDDMYGVLHCTKCGTQVKRWKVVKEDLDEEQLDEARIKIVKARIRGGKIQRRKKVSNVSGMTFRGGKLTRMSPAERRRRKMGQRRGKMKRKAKMTRTLMKRRRSLQKRRTLGLG